MTQTTTLAQRLTKARHDAGMTQAQAARHLGKPQSFISKLETRETQRPRFVHIVQLSRIYNVPLTWLAEAVLP